MAQTECIGPLKTAMKVRRDCIAQACEALMKMFSQNEDAFVEQVMGRMSSYSLSHYYDSPTDHDSSSYTVSGYPAVMEWNGESTI
jgi:hypothetical protein